MTFSTFARGGGISDTAKNIAPAASTTKTQTSRTRDNLDIERIEPRRKPDGNRYLPDAGDNDRDPYYNFVGNG